MFKSIYTLSTKSVIRISSKVNFCSSKNSKKREIILRTRSIQKQLYGEVIQTKSNGQISTTTKPLNPNNVTSELKVTTPERASEFYWLIQKGHNSHNTAKQFKILRFNKSSSCNDSPNMDETNTTISAKNHTEMQVSSKQNNVQKKFSQQIPFNEDALNSILNYSLICSKCELNRTEDLIADKSLYLPSISKILQATMPESSRIALKKWKLGKIAELGYDGFKQYEKETFDRGTQFHSAIERFLGDGTIPDRNSSIIKLWDSIDNSLKELQPKPVLLEQSIIHTDLKYKGIIDNVSAVNDVLCAFEWKTSEKSKPRLSATYDAPVQLCAYLGALNSDPRYDLTVKNGCVVVAYKNGDAANVFNLTEADLRKYWLVWLKRLQEYWIRVRDGTLPDPI